MQKLRNGPAAGLALALLPAMLAMALTGAGVSSARAAQSPPPRQAPPINGSVVALHGQTLQIMAQEQTQVSVTLPPKVRIVDQEPGTLADVKSGEFIGTTAVQEADGKLHAREIHIFPESMRGTGEGHYPMAGPNTTMTNGNVESVTGSVAQSAGTGTMLSISYKGGQSMVEVPSNVSVTMMRVGKRSLLKPGANITVLSRPNASGTLTAALVIVHGRKH
ncbi:MAG: hypothetical protein ACREU2_13705 [Steroidobacteraceae bacterium]